MNKLEVGSILFLLWNSITDIRKKEVSMGSVWLFLIFRLICFIAEIQSDSFFLELKGIGLGLIPGLVLLALGKLSGNAIGMGDGIIVCLLGVYLGIKSTVMILLWGTLLTSFWSIFCLIVRKYRAKSQVPFVPFLFVGLILFLLLER